MKIEEFRAYIKTIDHKKLSLMSALVMNEITRRMAEMLMEEEN